MFAKAHIPTMIPEIMKEWSDILKQNSLLFTPENICESPDFKDQMSKSAQIFTQKINPQLYQQAKAPAEELEMQKDRWYQDFSA